MRAENQTRTLLALSSVSLFFALSPSASPADIIRLTGTVLERRTVLPVRNVKVIIRLADNQSSIGEGLTDEQGKFAVRLPARGLRLRVELEKPGYLPDPATNYEVKQPATGDDWTALTFQLIRSASVSGTVLVPIGAKPSLSVYSLQPLRGITSMPLVTMAVGEADEHGNFRVGALHPGSYILAVAARFNMDGYGTIGPVYFPGAASLAKARIITVQEGEDREGLVIDASSRNESHSIHGSVGQSQEPKERVMVFLYSKGFPEPITSTLTDAQGNFSFSNISAGEYHVAGIASVIGITASAALHSGPLRAGVTNLTLNGSDLDGIVLVLREAVVASFQLTLSKARLACAVGLTLRLEPTMRLPLIPVTGHGNREGTTGLPIVPGLSYRLLTQLPPGCHTLNVRGDTFSNVDWTLACESNCNTKIALTEKSGSADGVVKGPNGEPVSNCVVAWDLVLGSAQYPALFPCDADGHFRAVGLSPGRHRVLAVPLDSAARLGDPSFWREHETTALVHVVEPGKSISTPPIPFLGRH